ncbi:MAG TPA: response regulator transcription factor [Dehalococcoidia bacterium]|jgi:DNA-binding NarL/FixJ family response regulator|nr:response regulator transcription factor [Dehalococcoidia bacterium]
MSGPQKRPTTVVIADDHPMIREGLRSILSSADMQVVGEAMTGSEAVQRVHEVEPDVVLMDVRMPDMDGLAATELIHNERPETAILILTSYETTDYLKRAVLCGAAGYVLKGIDQAYLIDAIRIIRNGESLIDRALLRALLADVSLEEPQRHLSIEALTERERTVLQMLARGLSNKEIAQQMRYSVGTIKNHVQRVIDKLGVSDRTQAAILAVKTGLVASNPELATGQNDPAKRLGGGYPTS